MPRTATPALVLASLLWLQAVWLQACAVRDAVHTDVIPGAMREIGIGTCGWSPVVLSGDGNLVAQIEPLSGGLSIWDARTAARLRGLEHAEPLDLAENHLRPMPHRSRVMAIDANGTRVATQLGHATIAVWDVHSSRLLWRGIQPPIRDTYYTPEKVPFVDGGTTFLTGLAFRPDGKVLAANSFPGMLSLWDVESGKMLDSLQTWLPTNERPRRGVPWDVEFTPDGRSLVVSWPDASDGGRLEVWDVSPFVLKETIRIRQPWKARITLDGRRVAVISRDGTVRIWSRDSKRVERTLRLAQSPFSFDISPDGRLVAAGHWNGRVTLWSLETGKPVRSYPGLGGPVLYLRFTGDEQSVAMADNTVAGLTIWPLRLDPPDSMDAPCGERRKGWNNYFPQH